jgi:DNA-binding XRE family transcriptional regulator
MDESIKVVYRSLIQSYQHFNRALEQNTGSDGLLEKKLRTILADFEGLFEYIQKGMGEDEIAQLGSIVNHSTQKRSFGEVIRYRREKRGLSKEQLADAIGVSPVAMAQFEANTSIPTTRIYNKLLLELDITPSGLLDQVPPLRTNADRIREMIALLDELKEQL